MVAACKTGLTLIEFSPGFEDQSPIRGLILSRQDLEHTHLLHHAERGPTRRHRVRTHRNPTRGHDRGGQDGLQHGMYERAL